MIRAVLLIMLSITPALAGELRIAVASNFRAPLDEIVTHFERETGHEVVVSSGSTGKLFAQITNGAPFDVFLAADSERPLLLESRGLAVANTRVTYALGRLALWSLREDLPADLDAIFSRKAGKLAIANPALAPYGRAAEQVIASLKRETAPEISIARGENIGQVYAFVASGNADLGFVALSQIRQRKPAGWYVVVPDSLHTPIRQDAVLLERAKDNVSALAFMNFLESAASVGVLDQFGYGVAQ